MKADDIKTLRESLGWTQEQFAAACHTDEWTVCRWERGRSKPGKRSLKLLEGLKERGR